MEQECAKVFADRVDPDGVKSFWIGLSDLQETNRWIWTDGSDTIFTNWNKGEPNNPDTEHCAYMYGSNNVRKWNNIKCDNSRFAICQKQSLN